jgi:hypothetical protein
MKFNSLNKRLAMLEERAKPRLIATLADYVIWCANWKKGIREDVEFSPAMEEAFGHAPRGVDHEA